MPPPMPLCGSPSWNRSGSHPGSASSAANDGRIAAHACSGDPPSAMTPRTAPTKPRTTGVSSRYSSPDIASILGARHARDEPVEQLDLRGDELLARLVDAEPPGPVDLGELGLAARARRPLHRERVAAHRLGV